MWGSSQSLDSFSGILFPSSFFRTNRSLSRADLSIYFIWFCLRSRGLMTAKKLDAALCLALLKTSKSFLAFASFFSNSLIRSFSSWSSLLISGCLAGSLQEWTPRHDPFLHVCFVWPGKWQTEQVLARFSAMVSHSAISFLRRASWCFALSNCTCIIWRSWVSWNCRFSR